MLSNFLECEEYSKLTKRKIYYNLFYSESAHNHAHLGPICDYVDPLIINGEQTLKGEFPHMTAIGYRSSDGSVTFSCSGSLISDQFILTVAHCSEIDGEAPSFVRLGDQNLNHREDGMNELDVDIDEFISHEGFNSSSYYYDIAVIRLSESVKFSKFIRPACLVQPSNSDFSKVIASHWAISDQMSNELTKAEFVVVDNERCNSLIRSKKLKDGVVNSQLCAGTLSREKESCKGGKVTKRYFIINDIQLNIFPGSGGAIQIIEPDNPCLYHIVGVTSFGSWFCGLNNQPDIFTRVSSYLDWIEQKVWGEEDCHCLK